MSHIKRVTYRSPVFIHFAACALNRRPITSIKSQPSRNGMASNFEKSDSTTVSQPISARKAMFSSTCADISVSAQELSKHSFAPRESHQGLQGVPNTIVQ